MNLPPWFQREPYPSMVGVLLDHQLLDEGGTDALRLAGRLARAGREAMPGREVEAVTERLATEHSDGALAPEHVVATWLVEAAQDLVDALTEHTPRGGDVRA